MPYGGLPSGDISYFQEVATTLGSGKSIYELDWQVHTLPPLPAYIFLYVEKIGQALGISFPTAIRSLGALVDSLMFIMLMVFANQKGWSRNAMLGWGAFFALNPTSVFVTGTVGQIDNLMLLFCFAAALITMLSPSPARWKPVLIAGLLLGISISIKTLPVAMGPLFLGYLYVVKQADIRKLAAFFVCAALPWGLQLIPFATAGETEAFLRTIRYMFLQSGGGGLDYGLGSINAIASLGVPVVGLNSEGVSFINESISAVLNYGLDRFRLLLLSKVVFAIVYFYILFKNRAASLALNIQLTLLAVLTFVGGIFAYYLVWVLPFGITQKDKSLVAISIIGVFANIYTKPFAIEKFGAPIQAIYGVVSKSPYLDIMNVALVGALLVALGYNLFRKSPAVNAA